MTEKHDHWHDNGWHTRVWVENPEIVMAYEVREVCGGADKPLFRRKGSKVNDNDFTDVVEEAHVHIRGNVKWDGCSHNSFPLDIDSAGYLHSCGREHLTALGAVFGYLYDEAIRLLGEQWREYLL